MYLRRLRITSFRRKPRPKISLLIPFSTKDKYRKRTFKWLLKYWKHELPDAEIIIGKSRGKPFCKGEALNNAAREAKGKVLVILDADAYISGKVLDKCADQILENLENHLWFVPYRHLYRLTKGVSEVITSSCPEDPVRIPCPPPDEYVSDNKDRSKYGHRYGAMIMMFPREALEVLGCFDERFRGWGGEDVALLRALDTLYGKHKTKRGCVFHLWHPFIGENYKTRVWEGQEEANANQKLANKYHKATRHPSKMRKLVDDGCNKNKDDEVYRR